MTSLSNFVNDHIVYILNECLIETTKFNEKSEKNELVEKIMLLNYQKSKPIAQSLIK
jgi:sulfopyruvate decarboxylase TPP-binding subunit